MNLRKVFNVSMVAMAFLFTVGAAAMPKDSKTMAVPYDATVAGAPLTSGDYNITWQTHSPEATVTFRRGSKVAATADGKVVDRGTKYSDNSVVFGKGADGTRIIQELRFRGSSKVIVFNE